MGPSIVSSISGLASSNSNRSSWWLKTHPPFHIRPSPKMDFSRTRRMGPPVDQTGCCWTKTRLFRRQLTRVVQSNRSRPILFVTHFSSSSCPAPFVAAWTREGSASSDHIPRGDDVLNPAWSGHSDLIPDSVRWGASAVLLEGGKSQIHSERCSLART